MPQARPGEEVKYKFSRENNGMRSVGHTCTPNKPDVLVLQGKIEYKAKSER